MSSDKLKLYEWTASPNSRRVRIYLAEKGLKIPFVPVNLDTKEQFSAGLYRRSTRGASCRRSCSRTARRSARSWRSGAISRRPIPSRR